MIPLHHVSLDAITDLHVHGARTAGEVSWLWGEQEKCSPPIMQEVYEKGPRDHNRPICTLSRNGYGDQRVKGTRCTCCLPLERSQLYTGTGGRRRSGYGAHARSVCHQSCKMTTCRRPFSQNACMAVTAQLIPSAKMAPLRAEPNGFLVHHLKHSATLS